MKEIIPADRVRELFTYDHETGVVCRIKRMSNRAPLGPTRGWDNGKGYGRVMLDGERVYIHQLAWLLSYGHWPNGELDHINGDRLDNRIVNLCEVSREENMQNIHVVRTTTGRLGVSFDRLAGKFVAQISVKSKNVNLGRF